MGLQYMGRELFNTKIEGIDFVQDAPIEGLAAQFKNEIFKIGRTFRKNENDRAFSHLRKFYASALRRAYFYSDPSNVQDPEYEANFTIFQGIEGFGQYVDTKVYTDLILPRVSNRVSEMFFVDENNPYLYQEASLSPPFTNYTGFGLGGGIPELNVGFDNAVRGESEDFEDICLEIRENSKVIWYRAYQEKLFSVFGYPMRKAIERENLKDALREF